MLNTHTHTRAYIKLPIKLFRSKGWEKRRLVPKSAVSSPAPLFISGAGLRGRGSELPEMLMVVEKSGRPRIPSSVSGSRAFAFLLSSRSSVLVMCRHPSGARSSLPLPRLCPHSEMPFSLSGSAKARQRARHLRRWWPPPCAVANLFSLPPPQSQSPTPTPTHLFFNQISATLADLSPAPRFNPPQLLHIVR
jgi:hypothetical protein